MKYTHEIFPRMQKEAERIRKLIVRPERMM
jgi:hypothetical protein